MNLSDLVTRIKLDLGIYAIPLPIDNFNEMVMDILRLITIPVFSLYCPHREIMFFDTRELEKLTTNQNHGIYLLPDFHERKLLYVLDVSYNEDSTGGVGISDIAIPYANFHGLRNLMVTNASANLSRISTPSLKFRFTAPRTIELFNQLYTTTLKFELMFEHDKSLQTITPTTQESFYKLAVLDVKQNLYNLMKHYTDIQTVYGSISLKLDDWQNAESERKELLSQWDETFHLDLAKQYYQ